MPHPLDIRTLFLVYTIYQDQDDTYRVDPNYFQLSPENLLGLRHTPPYLTNKTFSTEQDAIYHLYFNIPIIAGEYLLVVSKEEFLEFNEYYKNMIISR